MTAQLVGTFGRMGWDGKVDTEGHREYHITFLVKADVLDGPQVVMNTPGLAPIGFFWAYGNDWDPWAICRPDRKIAIHQEKKGDPNRFWTVEQTFSTKPTGRCQDTTIEDPLLEPPKVSGGFVKYTEEATHDRWGAAIKSSSHEMLRGPNVEFDHNRPTVRIEQNVSLLQLNVFSAMVDTVNDDWLWGLSARKIKLSNASWTRKVLGVCDYYFTRVFEFDVDFRTFDRDLVDEGTKAFGRIKSDSNPPDWEIPAGWDRCNPLHYTRYKDQTGENARVLLDGNGNPLQTAGSLCTGTGEGTGLTTIHVEYYDESNFLLLGIPTVLG